MEVDIVGYVITSVIPIGIAIWTVRSSAKDTAKYITAISESTTKQVESVKKLTRALIEVNKIQIGNELQKERNYHVQINEKIGDVLDQKHISYQLGISATNTQNYDDKYDDLSYERDFHLKRMRDLSDCLARLSAISKEIEGD